MEDELTTREQSFVTCYCTIRRLRALNERITADDYLRRALGDEMALTIAAFERTFATLRADLKK